MTIESYLVFSDVHVPFHDPKKVDLVMCAAEDLQPECVIANGDILDFYNVSSFMKHPDVLTTVDEELDAGYEFFERMRDILPKSRIVFLYGNHEDRLERLVLQQLPVFYNRLRLHNELKLDNLDIEWHPYNRPFQIADTALKVMHSPPSYSQNAARASLNRKTGESFIYGCTHRPDQALNIRQEYGNEVYDEVIITGGLFTKTLSEEHNRVFSYDKNNSRTGSSVALVTVTDGLHFSVEHSKIKDYRLCLAGNVYEV